jgi:hypothetical protein
VPGIRGGHNVTVELVEIKGPDEGIDRPESQSAAKVTLAALVLDEDPAGGNVVALDCTPMTVDPHLSPRRGRNHDGRRSTAGGAEPSAAMAGMFVTLGAGSRPGP